MQGMMEIYMLYSFSRGLEENKFKYRLPDYIYYFMIVIPIILLATSWMKVYSLSGALLSSITLTWSLANYNSLVNFYFMSMKASLLPAVSIGFRLILDGKKSALVHVAGMFAGYIYNCLETKSFGPLAGMLLSMQGADTNVHPNRVGTLSSVNSQWFYATGDLPAPMWLKSLVTRLIGVNYTQAPRHGYHVINSGTVPATSPASAASSSGFLKNPFEKPAFKGKGQRLGSN
ncbi:unnamed protein product [Kuraishia capsulata CBS 1993]|uniref:Derlin n=1 Tax=Kuraishia capsulata CBS 1993 TaxID=1382522 RepID=W6MFA5_9ASCO|nr:uncharacterized protein KUCA_T00000126001 [Kuraishia capsulata CBS 1993]CDK24166.1 unnamed protein product [Kuraishia capsulata CBS 1993]